MAATADLLLTSVYDYLGIRNFTDEVKYSRIDSIVERLAYLNEQETIHPKTTGTISERICELALRARASDIYKKMNDDWNWMGDFSLLGHPFNLLISVKSFKAKERLLVSGSGNILSPTVGWGLFDDPDEWTEARTRIYLFRSFIGIYLPMQLFNRIPETSRSINNINGKRLLRPINYFMDDISNAIQNHVIDITAF